MFNFEKSSLVKNDEFLQRNEENAIEKYEPFPPAVSAYNRVKNGLNPGTYIEHKRSNFTILRSACKKWDPKRLEKKHKMLAKIGAEHVQMKTKEGDLIDVMYIDLVSFLDHLKRLGGRPVVLSISDSNGNPYQAQPVQVRSEAGTCQGLKIHLSEAIQDLWSELMTDYDLNGCYVYQEDSGDFLIVKREDQKHLELPYQIKRLKTEQFPKELAICSELEGREIHGFYFEQDTEEVKEVFNALKLSFPWRLEQCCGHWFIVKDEDSSILKMASLTPSLKSLQIAEVKAPDFSKQPTVLLSMNQTASYEAYTEEFLTFLFLGVNVCAYNNACVGLSKGWNTSRGMNEAVETIYHFLTKRKGILPEEIIVKGQCSGFVRTSKFIKDHKKVNVWSDQAPVNFTDVSVNMYQDFLNKATKDMDDCFLKKTLVSLKSSEKMMHLAQKMVPQDQTHLDIEENVGHKLMTIDVPDEDGNGGDELVPDQHVEMLIDGFKENKGKIAMLAFIPGGEHVTHWFLSKECYGGVVQFLDQAQLRNALFEKRQGTYEQQFAEDLSHAFKKCAILDQQN